MAKKKTASTRSAAPATPNPTSTPREVAFPDLSPKPADDLSRNVLLEDQIVILDNVLSLEECRLYVKFIDSLPLELTPPKKRGEADRLNYRLSITSAAFAQRLFAILQPHLPLFPYPASKKRTNATARPAHSFNSNIRLYRYTPSQHFGQHYDDSVRDTETGAVSEWTLLIYLTGVEDGVEGGEDKSISQTIFYTNDKGKSSSAVVAPLVRGSALLHRHGHECLLHEGSPVQNGTKYVLRSDVMFIS